MESFSGENQRRAFDAVRTALLGLGYEADLLRKSFGFNDWFSRTMPTRTVPLVAFGRQPVSYDSACCTVLLENGKSGVELVSDYRALGAPVALELASDEMRVWTVAAERARIQLLESIRHEAIERYLHDQSNRFSSQSILRAKNLALGLPPEQLDFIDLGLIPALEHEIRQKLDRRIREALDTASRISRDKNQSQLDVRRLFRLIFRSLASKVFADRGVTGFTDAANLTPLARIRAIESYYGDTDPTVDDPDIVHAITEPLWKLNYENLSVDALAYVYESTLVTRETRKRQGIHSTPSSLARYVVQRLPFESIPAQERYVSEPFCGHAIFLVAALQRLSALLGDEESAVSRHQYLVERLRGFEIDSFALEVARLCMMLADFPNKDGWQLHCSDVFRQDHFRESLSNCRILLSNPPFEDFQGDTAPDVGSRRKPVAFLDSALNELHGDGILGLVLPRKFLDGASYRQVRERITRRFAHVEIVSLPDNVFSEAKMETVLVLASKPVAAEVVSVFFRHVAKPEKKQFLSRYQPTWEEEVEVSVESASSTLLILPLTQLWNHTVVLPRLGDIAKIHRGIEWIPSVSFADQVSEIRRESFVPGVERVAGRLVYAFEQPSPVFLSAEPSLIKGNKRHLPWSVPKLVTNAARVSLGFWCSVGFADYEGLLLTQRFHCIWPLISWTPRTLACVLNGPLANAYISVRENKRDIHGHTLKSLPMPVLGRDELALLDDMAGRYETAVVKSELERARELLVEIDGRVLAGYMFTEEQLAALISFCAGHVRPVPFDFTYPEDFVSTVVGFSECRDRDQELDSLPAALLERYHALLDRRGDLSDVEARELADTRAKLYDAHLASPQSEAMSNAMDSLHRDIDERLDRVMKLLESL